MIMDCINYTYKKPTRPLERIRHKLTRKGIE